MLIVPEVPVAPAVAEVAPDVPVAPAVDDGEEGLMDEGFMDEGFAEAEAVSGFADVAGFDGFVEDSVFAEGAIEPLLEVAGAPPAADC